MDIEKVKRYSLIEVVLLAIFMIGLLIASLIVKGRTRVLLSEPLTLFGSGLSASMPANSGWEYTPVWQYEKSENCMILVGQFRSPGRGSIEVRWRYILSTPKGTEQDLLQQQARNAGAVIQNLDTIDQTFSMVYARMYTNSAAGAEEFYLGIMRLDFNRSIELLVKSSDVNGYYKENVFKSLAGSVQYQTPQKLTDGHALIDEFLKVQSESLSAEQLPDKAYLIKDAAGGSSSGYYFARHSLYAEQEQTLRQLQIRKFESKILKLESSLWFNPLNRDYRWKTDLRFPGIKKPQTYEIETDESGALLVKCNIHETKTFPADQFFLPEPLVPELARLFLQSGSNEVIVDVLGAVGQLVPVYLEKIPPQQAKAKSEETDAVVRVVYLHAQNSFEELFFDDSQSLIGKFEQQPRHRARIWDAVSTEELERIFKTDFQASSDVVAFNK
ncbi:MAG: RNA-binding protein [Planctomycetota bacterium]|jgi:hypothetical protein